MLGYIGVDPENGDRLWRYTENGNPVGKPSINQLVYLGTDHRFNTGPATLSALNPQSGDRVWTTTLNDTAIYPPTSFKEGEYLAVRSKTGYHLFDGTTGDPLWSSKGPVIDEVDYDILAEFTPVPIPNSDLIVFPDSAGVAVLSFNGSLQWRTNTQKVRYAPTVTKQTIYVSDISEGVYAYDAIDGTEQWHWQESGVWGTPILENSVLYITVGQDVVALDATDGSKRWRANDVLHGDVHASSVYRNGVIYITTIQNSAVAVTEPGVFTNGVRWRLNGEPGGWASPALLKNKLFVISGERLLALELDT